MSQFKDTIKNLNAGVVYYVRVTDQCGVYVTSSFTSPSSTNKTMTYGFEVFEPKHLLTPNAFNVPTKRNCIQWGRLRVFGNGTEQALLQGSNQPVKVTITRQDNGNLVEYRRLSTINSGVSYPYGGELYFDSIPRVPVNVRVQDTCGFDQTFAFNALPLPRFELQAFNKCISFGARADINTYSAAPSYPITFKVFDASDNLLHSREFVRGESTTMHLFKQGDSTSSLYNHKGSFLVPAFGNYKIVMIDDCGRTDTLVHDFQPGTGGSATAPTYSFKTYQMACATSGWFRTTVTQTNSSPVLYLKLVSGPTGVTYPQFVSNYVYNNITTDNVKYLFINSK
ncbi:MAG: hypothetical protein EOP47_29090 [Sphingobacteriaceae bacterium]|nr:MAG: hypothetical protein EOP47_29090 [Sphingobacteriaceae bacterium]